MRRKTAALMLFAVRAARALLPSGRRVLADAGCRCKFSQRLRTLAASRSDLEQLTVPVLKDRLRAQGLKVGGKKAELIERLLGPGEIEDELDCDVPMAVTAMSPTVLIEACKS